MGELAKINVGGRGLQLNTLTDMRDTAQIILQSGLCPDGYKTREQVFVGLQSGAEIGLPPMQALNSIAVIRGKPCLWGDAALALVRKSGLMTKFSEEIQGAGDAMFAKVVSEREGSSTVTTTFSVIDARTANLWGKAGPWKTHPKRMLKYKARAFNLRDNFPDVLMGMHLQEEMVGEVVEPMEKPKCDVPPRAERRQVVVNATAGEEIEEGAPVSFQPAKKVESNDITPDKPVESPAMDSAGVGDDDHFVDDNNMVEAEVIDTEIVLDSIGDVQEKTGAEAVDLRQQYELVTAKAITKDITNFVEYAADTLCREEEEVDSPEKFTLPMLDQLKRSLDAEGM